MTSNPFVFIVQLVATLQLIPAEGDVLGWQAAINALQPAILLPVNVSTAHAHLSDIWTTPPSSTAVGALAGLDGRATALQAIHWSIKPDRNHPDAIGHGSITGMTSNPFVFIVQLFSFPGAYEGHIRSMAVTFEIYSGAGASSSISPISTRHS
ncbi:uncharacterized protein LOC142784042 [Rhipicephalus microplus]|uniref:uncharacterized protein LOC142784042 n=1 Tax=Rhipicephalus microplus TaxID=6941 RepID=UPI003F6A728A